MGGNIASLILKVGTGVVQQRELQTSIYQTTIAHIISHKTILKRFKVF